MEALFPILGFALCAMVGVYLTYFVVQGIGLRRANFERFRTWQQQQRRLLDQQLTATQGQATESNAAKWAGWRRFKVARIDKETADAASIYLKPLDGRPLPSFYAGQFITLSLQLPKTEKPTARCYSLSDVSSPNHYRITVKRKPVPAEAQSHSLSRFLVTGLMVGDVVDVRHPAGDFTIDPSEKSPLVFLAAGVGVTPLFCMAKSLLQENPEREILFVYGNKNSATTILADELSALQSYQGFHLVNCFTEPLESDVLGRDFQVQDRVSIKFLKKVLKNHQFKFYLCGPVTFIQDLHQDLLEWGVPQSRIHFEAFGRNPIAAEDAPTKRNVNESQPNSPATVVFRTSEGEIEGESVLDTILEIAEELKVDLNSGCRSGNCGTCAIRLLQGRVVYPPGETPQVDPGYCLACIAKPVGKVEVET
ncbi:MAG: 2Fe-2S iron-sulfur cluster-binding protein [Pirellulaceae bacterium]